MTVLFSIVEIIIQFCDIVDKIMMLLKCLVSNLIDFIPSRQYLSLDSENCSTFSVSEKYQSQNTVNVLNIRTPQKFVVITLKFELCCSTIE